MRTIALIPTHGRPTLLYRTLSSLAECERPPSYEGCVVVENGPASGAEEVVAAVAEAHPEAGLRYQHVATANKSLALNAAIDRLSDDHLLLFFDDDIRLHPSTIVHYTDAAARSPGRYYGGPTECDYEAPPPDWLIPSLPMSARGFRPGDADDVSFFPGCNWAAFARDLRASGTFDPQYGPGSPSGARGQESLAQDGLRSIGVQPLYIDGALVWHYVPRERCSLRWALGRTYQVGLMAGQRADRTPALRRAYLAARMAAATVAFGLRGDRVQASRRLMLAVKNTGALIAVAKPKRH